MKRYAPILALSFILLGFSTSVPAENLQGQICVALNPFFQALKAGNMEIIKQYVTGDLYYRKRVLLEENKEYGNFLKKIYRDARFDVLSINQDSNGDVLAEISVMMANGTKRQLNIYLTPVVKGPEGHDESIVQATHWSITGEVSRAGLTRLGSHRNSYPK